MAPEALEPQPHVPERQGTVALVVPALEAERLAESLILLLTSPELRVSLGQRLQHRVRESYSAEAAIERISQVYNSVLEQNP